MKKLILFDIDNTLIKTPRAHNLSFSVAFKKVYGIETTIDIIEHPGMPDSKIIIEVLKRNGLTEEEIKLKIKECMREMIDYFRGAIKNEELVVLGGVEELLKELSKRNCILGVVTGNLRPIAEIKLNKTGLSKYFKVGAFGDESVDRTQLVKLAIERAKEKFNFKSNDNVFLIGDTPKDVKAGKEVGAKVIAVVTGKYNEEELRGAGADFIVKSLEERNKILKIISSV